MQVSWCLSLHHTGTGWGQNTSPWAARPDQKPGILPPPPADFQGVKTSVQHLGVLGWVTWRVGG